MTALTWLGDLGGSMLGSSTEIQPRSAPAWPSFARRSSSFLRPRGPGLAKYWPVGTLAAPVASRSRFAEFRSARTSTWVDRIQALSAPEASQSTSSGTSRRPETPALFPRKRKECENVQHPDQCHRAALSFEHTARNAR